MNTSISTLNIRRIVYVLAAALVLAASLVASVPTSSASAANCRVTNINSWNSQFTYGMENDDNKGGYYHSNELYVPSWSTCRDINIRLSYVEGNPPTQNAYFRVRFIPPVGTSFTYGWDLLEPDGSYHVVSRDAYSGTRYRIEATPQYGNPVKHRPIYSVLD